MTYTSGLTLNAGSTDSYTTGCMYQQAQMSFSAGATFGGEGRWWGHNCNCWTYLRWNTSCTNTAGIAGPGGDCGPTGTAYNTPGATYACSTSDQSQCARYHASPPGYFPGGGGGGGYSTTCCNSKTAGGGGGAGYIRVIY